MWAATFGLTEIMQLLLANGANVNEKTYLGDMALSVAAMVGMPKSIKFLLDAWAKVEEKATLVTPH